MSTGMTLYQLDAEFEKLVEASEGRMVNTETGELYDREKVDALDMERDQKRENICFLIKNLSAELKAVTEEKKKFDSREKALKSKVAWWKNYLQASLDGEKFRTDKVQAYYGNSTSAVFDGDISECPAEYTEIQPPKLLTDKAKKALLAGEDIPGWHLEKKSYIVVK